jgi:hypothetical protein
MQVGLRPPHAAAGSRAKQRAAQSLVYVMPEGARGLAKTCMTYPRRPGKAGSSGLP